jgi:hypothetical protein
MKIELPARQNSLKTKKKEGKNEKWSGGNDKKKVPSRFFLPRL